MRTFADWHCDTASFLYENKMHLKENGGHISLEKLAGFEAPVQTFAVWLDKKYYNDAFSKTIEIIGYFKNEAETNNDKIELVKSFDDIQNNKKIGALLSIEGCEALEGSFEKLERLYDEGIRAATLTWNYKNCVATGVMESSLGGGLTGFGRAAVRKMEELGIIVDVSHISDEGFYDVEKNTQKPFIATHSNCRALCAAPRNLTDEQLKIIAERGGTVGLNMCPAFLNDNMNADIDDVLRHAEHMLDICGEDTVCLGCDFDGILFGPRGMEDVAGITALLDNMENKFGKEITYKIAKGNFMRIVKELL